MIQVAGSSVDGMNGVYRKVIHPPHRSGILSRQSTAESDRTLHFDVPSLRPSYSKCEDSDGDQWTLHYQERTGNWTFDSKNHDNASCHDDAVYPVDITKQEWKVWMAKESKYIECNTLHITTVDVVAHILESKGMVQTVHHYQPISSSQNGGDINGTCFHSKFL